MRLLLLTASVHIQWIPINLRVFLGLFLGFLKLLFQEPAAVLMRIHFLGKDLFARLFLLVEILDHVFERPERFMLLFMCEQRAGFGINGQGCFAAGTNNSKAAGFSHEFQICRG